MKIFDDTPMFLGCVVLMLFGWAESVVAQTPEDGTTVAVEDWTVLHLQNPRQRGTRPLPKTAKVRSLTDLQFTGPMPGHPYVLGNFESDGRWGLIDGYLQTVDGKNSALELCWADGFELEGIIEHAQFGGWYLLLGWDQERGYSLSNVKFKTSGSPWFLAEMRGGKSIADRTLEFDDFEWKGAQPFKLSVKNKQLTLIVGRTAVIETEIAAYQPGKVIVGVHDTNYGPKLMRIKSLRVRAVPNSAPDVETSESQN